MKTRVFIDGNQGTTGLKIYDRLADRDDIELLNIDEDKRKDPFECARVINSSDITFLCLPDDASRQAVAMLDNPKTRIIDTSTAHRTLDGWAYGFAELSPSHRNAIKTGRFVAVPGCHASGFVAVMYPLVSGGYINADSDYSCFSLTGYSGGGKKMIHSYDAEKTEAMASPKIYGLSQQHKHLKEMQLISGLAKAPIFVPVVDDYFSGMAVTVPLFKDVFKKDITCREVYEIYCAHYADSALVKVELAEDLGGIYAGTLSGYDNMRILVAGQDDRITVTALFDNLGKGASGAALQCLNIMLGVDETKGLYLKED